MRALAGATLASLVIVAAWLVQSEARSTTWGRIGAGDHLLQKTHIRRKGYFLSINVANVFFPPNGTKTSYELSAIKAIDHLRHDESYGMLKRGGPGYSRAIIRVRSERGCGLSFTIEFYGH